MILVLIFVISVLACTVSVLDFDTDMYIGGSTYVSVLRTMNKVKHLKC